MQDNDIYIYIYNTIINFLCCYGYCCKKQRSIKKTKKKMRKIKEIDVENKNLYKKQRLMKKKNNILALSNGDSINYDKKYYNPLYI